MFAFMTIIPIISVYELLPLNEDFFSVLNPCPLSFAGDNIMLPFVDNDNVFNVKKSKCQKNND